MHIAGLRRHVPLWVAILALGAPALASSGGGESAFIAENKTAMSRMMDGMMAPPSGDVDQDFMTMMTAHHQGAIDMAQAELRHGRNEQLRRIAQGIVVEQTQEIEAMRLAVAAR